MARSRVSSFFEKWAHPPRSPPPNSSSSFDSAQNQQGVLAKERPGTASSSTAQSSSALSRVDGPPLNSVHSPSPPPTRASGSRSNSRPASMVHTYQPPLMEVANDTPAELHPIFTYLNSHSNKLYQEGYFLKLHDLDSRGRPSADRKWQECFAQLVGTVLSLWDAADLDQAGEDGEVVPTFINIADASTKMIESLPMNDGDGHQLQNVLSISTAANNRYLLHFNSLNSLTQWTAGIRLAMYEHATLQEAYTGSLVAGKGKSLNNIRQLLERNRFKTEDWARVRFGAGTPWRRCWFVVSPPDEKEWEKAQKAAKKKSYGKPVVLKGDVKFYETRKITKKTKPIATITDAFSAYAIYPHSKPLIDQSTLVKIEGRITIHSSPESSTDGFVFVMPEVHPAISGFEMMLRFLFPLWDTFALYGRPQKLIADVLDQRGLMFAMPRDRRYGYLELLDVAGLIHTEGSGSWSERKWRASLKELTSKRMLTVGEDDGGVMRRRTASRTSLPGTRTNNLRFDDASQGSNSPGGYEKTRRSESAMAGAISHESSRHRRTASEQPGARPQQRDIGARFNHHNSAFDERDSPLQRPQMNSAPVSSDALLYGPNNGSETPSPDRAIPPEVQALAVQSPPPAPVDPPSFAHAPTEKPRTKPNQAPELRRGMSDLDQETLVQMRQATSGQNYAGDSRESSPGPNDYGYGPPQGPYQGSYQGQYQQSQPRGLNPAPQNNDYRRAQNRLSTIPASPFVEHDTPILDRAGQVIPPPKIAELSRSPSPANMATSAATAAMAKSSPHTRPTPDLQRQKTSDSASSQQTSGSVTSRHSIQRKPLGAEHGNAFNPGQAGGPVPPTQHYQHGYQQDAQWEPQHYQHDTHQTHIPQGHHNYSPFPPTQLYQQQHQQQSGPGQGPYTSQRPEHNYQAGYAPQQQQQQQQIGVASSGHEDPLAYRSPPSGYDRRMNGQPQYQGQNYQGSQAQQGWM